MSPALQRRARGYLALVTAVATGPAPVHEERPGEGHGVQLMRLALALLARSRYTALREAGVSRVEAIDALMREFDLSLRTATWVGLNAEPPRPALVVAPKYAARPQGRAA